MLEFRVNVSAWNHVPQVICTQTLVPARGCHSQPKRLVIGVRYCLQITNPGQLPARCARVYFGRIVKSGTESGRAIHGVHSPPLRAGS